MFGSRVSAARSAPVPESVGPAPLAGSLPPAGTLVGDVNLLAERWFGYKGGHGLAFEAGTPTPEALADMAARRGLDVTHAQRRPASLRDDEFPCILLDDRGNTRLLARRGRGGTVVLATREGETAVPLAALEEGLSGTVFFVRPRLGAAMGLAAPRDGVAGPAPAEPVEDAGGLMRLVLRHMVVGQGRLFLLLALAALVGNVLTLVVPIYSMSVYDRVVPHLAFETLWALTIGVSIAVVADAAVRVVRHALVDAMAVQASVSLQARLFARLLRMPLDKAPRNAALLNLWMRELDGFCQSLPVVLVAGLVDLPFLLVGIALLYALGGMVALVPVVGAVLLAVIFAASHHLQVRSARDSNALARAQATLVMEASEGLEGVKLAAAEGTLLRRFERLADAAAFAGHEARHWSVLGTQATLALSQFAIVAAMLIGVYVIADGAMTIGALSAVTLLIGRLMSPVSQFVAGVQRLRILTRSAEGLDKVLAAPLETGGDPSASAPAVRGALELRNVSFTYPEAHAPALAEVSLVVRPGERVAIIGRVGCGKSTLLRLLVRLLEPTTGAVMLDEAELRQRDPVDLRRQVALMRQDQALFDGTLRENLCFGLDAVSEEAFERAVTLSGVKDLAARNPAGYGQRIGPRGERLSGGERQMVALARTLMTDPRVLILDEPTAAMDNTLEARVVRELAAFAQGRTLVVATHRAQTLALADRIVWIEGGRIIADGPKEEVLRRLNAS